LKNYMATKVTMPQLGESVDEGTVTAWLKQVGDTVEEYEALLEVSTDKVTSEIPAPASGKILEIYVKEDETVEAGTLLCLIGEEVGEAARGGNGQHSEAPIKGMRFGKSTPAKADAAPAQVEILHVKEAKSEAPRLTPVVARMVTEHQLDPSQIPGTGLGGRVTRKDVEAYLERDSQPAAVTKSQPAPPAAAPVPSNVPGELVKLSNMRKTIAAHMVHSKLQTAPHVTTIFEADLKNVLAHMAAHKPEYAKQGVNLTLTAYFVAAMVESCRVYPMLNSRWTDDGIYIHHVVHVGIAVALTDGLIVPVLKNAESLNLLGIARGVNDLAGRAREGKLKPDEAQGGTISLTNHGVSGSLVATPIINQPQTAIFGVGMMEKRVKVINDAIAIRPCCYISLTFDHRVADGAIADAWMATAKAFLEGHPAS
jgi:pyruvate/2-oxoglutarate dehydrogenase complex dihydrolipoamide acyltransferase (E2) component